MKIYDTMVCDSIEQAQELFAMACNALQRFENKYGIKHSHPSWGQSVIGMGMISLYNSAGKLLLVYKVYRRRNGRTELRRYPIEVYVPSSKPLIEVWSIQMKSKA